ncbi:hypothetical protein MIMGU_mgv11b014724mg [Erythranthe guttata]|uniref:Uncharacterized protein n=1 Tax=Erythranthe guttata TaxID=4155 RepID=A0A022RXB4_ERYGU|nr:hypothetical protein MIMGU_mgv11b014724mg [Erythranthe guttata]
MSLTSARIFDHGLFHGITVVFSNQEEGLTELRVWRSFVGECGC